MLGILSFLPLGIEVCKIDSIVQAQIQHKPFLDYIYGFYYYLKGMTVGKISHQ